MLIYPTFLFYTRIFYNSQETDLEEEIPLCYACRLHNRAPITLLFLFPKRKKKSYEAKDEKGKGEGRCGTAVGENAAWDEGNSCMRVTLG